MRPSGRRRASTYGAEKPPGRHLSIRGIVRTVTDEWHAEERAAVGYSLRRSGLSRHRPDYRPSSRLRRASITGAVPSSVASAVATLLARRAYDGVLLASRIASPRRSGVSFL